MRAPARRPAANGGGSYRPPLSVTRAPLLKRGSDREFRRLIWALLIVSSRLQKFPEAFGHRIGISSAMYAVLIAAAHRQGGSGVGVKSLADHMHLPAPHVTTTVGKLVAARLLAKRPNPADGRGVLVSLTSSGRAALARLAPYQSEINNVLFDRLDKPGFAALSRLIDILVGNSARALAKIANEREKIHA